PKPAPWRHVEEEVPPPSRVADTTVPPQLDEIVVRATRRDPAARPRDAAALRSQIQETREHVAAALSGPTRAMAHPTVAPSPTTRLPAPRAAGRAAPGPRPEGKPPVGERIRASVAPASTWLGGLWQRLRTTERGRRQLTAG